MSTELSVAEKPGVMTVIPTTTDMLLSAETPEEMSTCQSALILWCDTRIKELEHEYKEMDEAYKHAVAHKWKASPLKRQRDLIAKRVTFYTKMRGALQNGYIMVPNFPVQMFAIRTNEDAPLKMVSTSTWSGKPSLEQPAKALPAGEGSYENPFPEVWQRSYNHDDGKGNKTTKYESWAAGWKDLEFPLTMAKPKIMSAVDRAMALRLFDEFGILPGVRVVKGDPIIVGRIIDPRSTKYSKRVLTFIIAWHVDTRQL